jgi:hypothetical protein
MKTAVEWLAEQYNLVGTAEYEQAKEMENQQQDKNKFSEEDLNEAYSQGWMARERFDDLSPDITYPIGLDYEEKQEYAFNLWLDKYKNK